MKRLILCLAVVVLVGVARGQAWASIIADSVSEFSDTQGQDGWYYGYYDGDLTPDTFKLLPHYDGVGVQDRVTLGWSLQLGPGGYWTTTHQWGGHPNGTNGNIGRLPVEQWAVRRWVSEVSGEITISGSMRPINGAHMLTHVIIDGSEVFQHEVPNAEFNYEFAANVSIGSTVDFVISPDNHNDVNGDTRFTAVISSTAIPEPSSLIVWLLIGLTFVGIGRRRVRIPF